MRSSIFAAASLTALGLAVTTLGANAQTPTSSAPVAPPAPASSVAAAAIPAPGSTVDGVVQGSRWYPDPLESPPFPNSDYECPTIGESHDWPDYPLQKALFGNKLDASRVKIYGWVDAGGVFSDSKNSTTPESYSLAPNRFVLDQAVLRIEKQPNEVQTTSNDWGFRVTGITGVDYRYTIAKGYFSDPFFNKNHLSGSDAPEMYFQEYYPKIGQGTTITAGRYISPMDIEAQLAPQNYLYTHSVMFTYDPYTFTGVSWEERLSEGHIFHLAFHGGNDVAPWSNSSHLNAEMLYGYQTPSAKDSIWTGLDSIGIAKGSGQASNGHENEQVAGCTWAHSFPGRLHMETEGYYIFQYDTYLGGTAINGPSMAWAGGGGAGPIIPGRSTDIGFVNYMEYELDGKDYLSYRTDFLDDGNGAQTGFINSAGIKEAGNDYFSFTLGLSHHVNQYLIIRPEARYDICTKYPIYGMNYTTDNNGAGSDARMNQWTIGGDIIQWF